MTSNRLELDIVSLAEIARLSYSNENEFKESISNYLPKHIITDISNIEFFDAQKDYSIDAQMYMVELNENDEHTIIFSIRGTSSKKDILSDLYVSKKNFSDILISKHELNKKYKNIKVHSGFLKQYNSLKFYVIQKLIKCMQINSNKPICDNNDITLNTSNKPLQIIFTSHSLGAAVSVLLSTLLKYLFGNKVYIINYLFGCPKIGNSNFVNLYNDAIDETYRYVNKNDIVPRIPKINYKTTKNRIIIGEKMLKNSCYFYKKIGNVEDHFMKSYIEELKKAH
jgi:predicted lipase